MLKLCKNDLMDVRLGTHVFFYAAPFHMVSQYLVLDTWARRSSVFGTDKRYGDA